MPRHRAGTAIAMDKKGKVQEASEDTQASKGGEQVSIASPEERVKVQDINLKKEKRKKKRKDWGWRDGSTVQSTYCYMLLYQTKVWFSASISDSSQLPGTLAPGN